MECGWTISMLFFPPRLPRHPWHGRGHRHRAQSDKKGLGSSELGSQRWQGNIQGSLYAELFAAL